MAAIQCCLYSGGITSDFGSLPLFIFRMDAAIFSKPMKVENIFSFDRKRAKHIATHYTCWTGILECFSQKGYQNVRNYSIIAKHFFSSKLKMCQIHVKL